MKTSNILLWIAVAGLAAFTIYESRQSQIKAPCYDVAPKGVRVKVKNCDYGTFESQLKGYSKCNAGLNILYQDPQGNWETVDGPPFENPRPAVPDGSMHVTQSIQLNGLDQLNTLLDLLEPASENVPGPTTPTCTPKPGS
jgi:hypothetical protein